MSRAPLLTGPTNLKSGVCGAADFGSRAGIKVGVMRVEAHRFAGGFFVPVTQNTKAQWD